MSQYLHLRCGPFGLLLDIDCIEEVAVIEQQRDSHGLRLWRQQQLPVTDLMQRLGHAGNCAHQIVVRENEQCRILDVEAIAGLIDATPAQFRPFEAVTAEARRCLDLALPQADGRCLLRLRQPLDWL